MTVLGFGGLLGGALLLSLDTASQLALIALFTVGMGG